MNSILYVVSEYLTFVFIDVVRNLCFFSEGVTLNNASD